MMTFRNLRLIMATVLGMAAVLLSSPPLHADPLESKRPDWVETGLEQKERIAERNALVSTNDGISTEAVAYRDAAFDEVLYLPYWVFESGTFATEAEAEADALQAATEFLQFLCIHTADKHDGWFDVLNTGYKWDLPENVVKNYAVSLSYTEEKLHSFGNVTGTMYNVYLKVPNDDKRIGVLMEHRRQAISRGRTFLLGLGFGVITWECLCIAFGLSLYQRSSEKWRRRVLATSMVAGILPVLLVVVA